MAVIWIGSGRFGGVAATGGTVTDITIGGIAYRVHSFTTVGTSTFTVTGGGEVEYLIVAGGGSGATSGSSTGRAGGGGGGGGVVPGTLEIAAGSYTVVVGAGGAAIAIDAASESDKAGLNGQSSSVFTISASPGTGGKEMRSLTGNGASGNGFAAGTAFVGIVPDRQAGGGGGANEAGVNGASNAAGRGGNGITSSITGSSVAYGGGGGGGSASASSGTVGTGGSGGGGAGGKSGAGVSGTTNTGGGGGGTSNLGASGAGGSGIVIIRYRMGGPSLYDPDAMAYIAAVEAADGQALEDGVKNAINAFVVGCKADGIWSAIKASCILAGARTLNGALVPLVGTAPTNFNFVAGDYNRKTGLKGDGSTKYLNSNRNNNADPQNNNHNAVYATNIGTKGAFMGANDFESGVGTGTNFVSRTGFTRNRNPTGAASPAAIAPGLFAMSRNVSSSYTARVAQTSGTINDTSQVPFNSNVLIFQRPGNNTVLSIPTDARLAFYSIGESLDLAKLDARVTDLINAFGVAIP